MRGGTRGAVRGGMRAAFASLLVAAMATTARAQSPGGAPAPAMPPPRATASTDPPASATASEPTAPVPTASGAAQSAARSGDPVPRSPARSAVKPARRRTTGAVVATLPGFEMLPDGGSRLFVELTRSAPVEEKTGAPPAKRARGKGKAAARSSAPAGDASRLTFVIKGAEVHRRNNENALVTVHFNTPVARARLVPAGRDLRFVVDLRAVATPTWKVVAGKEDRAVLQIDFPRGEFLPNGAPSAPPPSASVAPVDATGDDDDDAK